MIDKRPIHITILYRLSHFVSSIHDDMWGLDFEHRLDEWDGQRYPYESTTCLSYHNLRKLLHITIVPELTGSGISELNILDVGCGKGKMLYVFSNIIRKLSAGCSDIEFTVSGLEYRKELVDIAELNVKLLLTRVPHGVRRYLQYIEIIYADAEMYKDLDAYNLFYLYNPFGREIMSAFIANVEGSLERNPRIVWIVYCNPYYEDILKLYGYKCISKFFYNTSVYKKI